LRLLPPYGAHHNGSILLISREDHARFSVEQVSNDLSSKFRSSDTTTSPGHPDDNTSILTRSTSPHITLIQVFDKSFCQNDQYMTEESEHYKGRSKVHKSPATSLDLDLTLQNKHTTRPGLPRAICATCFTKAKHVARFLLAPGP
jgi:hypothetical protein